MSRGDEKKTNEMGQNDPFLKNESPSEGGTFDPSNLDRTVIALPLLKIIKEEKLNRERLVQENKLAAKRRKTQQEIPPPKLHDVIIDINLNYISQEKDTSNSREAAQDKIRSLIEKANGELKTKKASYVNESTSKYSRQYLFASLEAEVIERIVVLDAKTAKKLNTERAIYRIWPDFEVKPFINSSISTVKADAAHSSFSALGKGIIWAVIDSGIDKDHVHFKTFNNVDENSPYHKDLTGKTNNPFDDKFGHGTHVAGIIAGGYSRENEIAIVSNFRDENGESNYQSKLISSISGMAPKCSLVSIKVLDEEGMGNSSSLIAAIAVIQEINGYGRDIKIHGVNLSLGYDFEPEWFACGQSPLCVEVDRLAKSGVIVIAAAGNTGYGKTNTLHRGEVSTGLPLSINDPGNADLAITVGSTHRDMPYTYGVSYFSSKGPTGDGRMKPDLVAPGEKIISCAAGNKKMNIQIKTKQRCDYVEDSGTSMAAPHVSGVIAAFLSIRREFIGRPEKIKEIFTATASDLKRDKYFQGHGLIDLMRAIQSV